MPYAPAVVERTMKVQEVLMQAISGKLTWLQAEEILGWQPRTLRRWRLRYQRQGYDGLWDRRRQQPSPRRAPWRRSRASCACTGSGTPGSMRRTFMRSRSASMACATPTRLSNGSCRPRPAARNAARGAATAAAASRAPALASCCTSTAAPMPGSRCCPTERQMLLPSIDDATKRVLYAQLVPAESTATVMAALWTILETHGLPQALYTDRAGWAFYTPKAGEPVDRDELTQVGRALARLGIEHIPAYSPQARGRSERLNRTFQGRLVNELRVAGITTVPPPTATCASISSRRTTAASPGRPPIRPRPLSRSGAWTSPTSSVTKTSAPWGRTTPSPSRASACRLTSNPAGAPAPGCASSCAAISMASTVSGSARAASATTMPGAGASPPTPRAAPPFSPRRPPYRSPYPPRPRRS